MKALLMTETNKCVHCFALAVRVSLCVMLLNDLIYCD